MSIPKTLKEARLRQGLSQESLGRKLRLPQNHISAMEAGKVDVRLSTLSSWARAVGLELLIAPREIVPAVEYLKREMSNSQQDSDRPAPALYEVSEMDDDEEHSHEP